MSSATRASWRCYIKHLGAVKYEARCHRDVLDYPQFHLEGSF